MAVTNPMSSLSYTNKDFQTIYPELLDLAKKLTYKWDPSISNESDPGVILLKLNAIIADKNNYNIDKNVLECFPLSVTQDANARQLFEQLGYDMHWYLSGTTPISLKWIGDISDTALTIPMFTMVTDVESSLVYTLLGNMSSTVSNSILSSETTNLGSLVGNITLPRTKETIKVAAIQGVINDYKVNGETLITLDKLDSENRLYFTENNIAENGIFIQNANDRDSSQKQGNFSSWSRVTNLSVAGFDDKVYRFGLLPNSDSCYIEFSDNIAELISNGIYISYITTDGASGNTIAKVIEQFYSTTEVSDPDDSTTDITLSTENTVLSNLYAVTNGSDPETIDNAYKNYKKTVGTFNTLVTIRDYINAVVESGLVSNGFVCDRTNDIQDSYNIAVESDNLATQFLQVAQKESTTLRYQNDFETSASGVLTDSLLDVVVKAGTVTFTISGYGTNITDTNSDGILYAGATAVGTIDYTTGAFTFTVSGQAEKAVTVSYSTSTDNISAFDLKMYLLQYVDDTSTLDAYKQSFSMANSDSFNQTVEGYLEDTKSIQHDFKDIEPNKYCMFKNKYPITCRIIPQYELTQLQASEVTASICNALYQNLSSKSVDFGQEISYDDLYDVILNSDERIKSVILEEITYTTYAVYLSGANYIEVKVSEQDSSSPTVSTNFRKDIYAKSVLAGNTQLLIPDETYNYALNQDYDAVIDNIKNIDTRTVFGDNFTSGVYTKQLQLNDCIRFYAPNLQDVINYSTYIKYVFNVGTGVTVSANADYKLTGNQYVVMMWQASDGANYTYHKYIAGDIIQPNFSMTDNNEVSGVTGANFPTADADVVVTDSTLNTSISNLIDGNNVLTTSKQIVIREIVQATAGGTNMPANYCYWILNKSITSNNREIYRLFNSASGITSQTYILQTGEYFIRTNETQTEMEILGAGTRIVRTKTANPSTPSTFDAWEVSAIDLENITETGISAFSDSDWFVFNGNTYTVTITEMQAVNIQDQATLKITRNSGASAGLYFAYDGTYSDSACTTAVTLENFTIEYQSLGDTTFTNALADIVLGSNESWKGMSILNVNMSPTSPQPLASGQSIIYYTTAAPDTPVTISGGNNVNLQSNIVYNSTGGTGLDTSVISATGEISYLSLYKYATTTNINVTFDSEGACTIKLTEADDSKTITFNLPAGRYLLPLSHLETSITELTATVQKTGGSVVTLYPINSSSSNLKLPNKYYLDVDLSDATTSTTFTLTITMASSTTANKYVQIDNVFKYSQGSNLPADVSYSDILNAMKLLDINNKFDYTHVVNDALAVPNPLNGSAFNSVNHIFNAYTIDQIDSIKVVVSNRSR